MTSTRDRILEAASTMLLEAPDSRLTVRAVAQRAGVGIGTLRHHFPTQRILLDAVLSSVYRTAMPDDHIFDASAPARERLVQSLRTLLTPVGVDDDARRFWADFVAGFVAPDAGAARATYVALSRQARIRVESWLAVLVDEGALAPGDNARRARMLLSVVNGLALERGLPSDIPPLEADAIVLGEAVDGVLASPTHGPARTSDR